MGDEYEATVYEQLKNIEFLHTSNRGGRTNNILALGSTDSNDQTQYIVSVMYASIFVFIIFICWIFVLLTMQCLGKKTVGFFSGSSFRYPPSFLPNAGRRKKKQYLTPLIVRSTFVTFAGFLLCLVYVMVSQGLDAVEATVNTLLDSSQDIQDEIGRGERIVSSLIDIGTKSKPIRDAIVEEIQLDNFCPPPVGQEFLVTEGISEQLVIVQTALNLLGDFYVSDLRGVNDYLLDGKGWMSDFEIALNNSVELIVKYLPFYWVPLISVVCLLLIGVFLAWSNHSSLWFQKVQSWAVLPFFLLWTILTWLMSCVFLSTAMANADMCSGGSDAETGFTGSPDETMMGFANIYISDKASITYTAVQYYVKACSSEYPYLFIPDYRAEIDKGIKQIDSFIVDYFSAEKIAALNNPDLALLGPQFNVSCDNAPNMLATREQIRELVENFRRIGIEAVETTELLSCKTWNPIYVQTIYEGTCENSVTALLWIFSTLLLIGTCSMVMITLRASIHPVVEPVKKSGNASEFPLNIVVTGLDEPKAQDPPASKPADPVGTVAEEEKTEEKELLTEPIGSTFSGANAPSFCDSVAPASSPSNVTSNPEEEKMSTTKNVMNLAADDDDDDLSLGDDKEKSATASAKHIMDLAADDDDDESWGPTKK